MTTAEGRRAAALAALLSLTACVGTAMAAPDPTAVAVAVRNLGADHDQAMAAVYVLQAGGERAAKRILDAWPSLSLLAQKRALGALSQLAKHYHAAIEALVEATRSDDEDLRNRALATLQRATPLGREGLILLLSDPLVGDRAALSLARAQPELAIEPLLEAMGDQGGSDRPGLRNALGTAAQRSRKDVEPQLRAWLGEEPTASTVGSAALALAALDEHRDVITSFVEYAAPKATGFPTEWRLLQSAVAAGPSDEIDRWVRSKLHGPREWMLRRAAVDAITARGHREDARASLRDPYPRVRARAATALSGDSDTLVERATMARRDAWPMVRAAAVRSLRIEGDATPVIIASVDDPMSVVRVAAIEQLSASSRDAGWERIHRRLRARDEWPRVTAAAIGYVVAHCRTDAIDALLRLIMQAAPSDTPTQDLNNAARAIGALRVLGTPEAEAALAQLRGADNVPPTLKIALDEPLPEGAPCAPEGR